VDPQVGSKEHHAECENSGNGESTNCHLVGNNEVRWHIYLTDSPAQQISSAIIVETTPRTLPGNTTQLFLSPSRTPRTVSLLLWCAFLLLPFSLFISRHLFSSLRTGTARRGQTWRATYWPPAAGIPAFKMEVAAAKMCAALWLGISFSVFSQCWM
jgi:hypothetical protein